MHTFIYPAKFEPGENPATAVITQGEGEKDAVRQGADSLEQAMPAGSRMAGKSHAVHLAYGCG